MRIAPHILLACAALAAVLPGCTWPPPTASNSTEQAIDRYVQARLLADEGKLDAALKELAAAVRADPSLSVAHAAAGDIHRKLGDHQAAAVSYEAACRTNPYEFRSHYNLGVTYQTLSEAARSFEKAQDYLAKAVDIYLRAITIRSDDFEANLNLSACYFQMGRYDQAEQYCLRALEIDPNHAGAYSNLGIIYDSQNQLYKAISAYQASLELDVEQPQLWLNLGSTYLRQARVKPALRAFEKAAEYDPASSAPHEQIGSCHVHLRDFDRAEAAYAKAVKINPQSAAAHRGLGVVYMSRYVLNRERDEYRAAAMEHWNRSLEIEPDQEDLRGFVRKYTPKLEGPSL